VSPSDHIALLCFDGSADAAGAIAAAGELLARRSAVVLTVWEPVSVWQPYDPGAVLGAGLAKLGSKALGLDEIASELAQEKLERGVQLAREAGFEARGQLAHGKTWRAICDAADELDAAPIVLGARGLSRVASVLLGSVSEAVLVHAKRPVLVIAHHESGEAGDSGT
jgi:nucleotide-binding universal stress UspA family protein